MLFLNTLFSSYTWINMQTRRDTSCYSSFIAHIIIHNIDTCNLKFMVNSCITFSFSVIDIWPLETLKYDAIDEISLVTSAIATSSPQSKQAPSIDGSTVFCQHESCCHLPDLCCTIRPRALNHILNTFISSACIYIKKINRLNKW